MDWPMAIKVAGADDDDTDEMNSGPTRVDDDDYEDVFRPFQEVDGELDPENTEVDDFIVDCLIDGEHGHTDGITREWGLLVGEIDG